MQCIHCTLHSTQWYLTSFLINRGTTVAIETSIHFCIIFNITWSINDGSLRLLKLLKMMRPALTEVNLERYLYNYDI